MSNPACSRLRWAEAFDAWLHGRERLYYRSISHCTRRDFPSLEKICYAIMNLTHKAFPDCIRRHHHYNGPGGKHILSSELFKDQH